MRLKVLISAAATAFVLSLASGGAKAATAQFQFTVVGPTVVDGIYDVVNTVTFELPESPSNPGLLTDGFDVKDVSAHDTSVATNVTNGSSSTSTGGSSDEILFSDASGGTETISDTSSWFYDVFSTLDTGAYFTGTTSNPTFVPGTYTGAGGESLTITNLSATPLPTTWTMLLAGIIGLGWFAYRGRKTGGAVAVA
jgi:hypothetical protein